MPSLSNWYFATLSSLPEDATTYLVWGDVLGHDKLPDGMFIHTSKVQNVLLSDNILTVTTANTEYSCPLQDFRITGDITAYENMLANIGAQYNISDIMEKMNTCVQEKLSMLSRYKAKIKDSMPIDSIFLDFSNDCNYLYNFGIYKGENSSMDLTKTVEVTEFNDTVTLTLDRTYHPMPPNNLTTINEIIEVKYSPFRGNIIEFYSTHPSNQKGGQYFGKIQNSGTEPLTVIFSWGLTATIQPHSSLDIRNQVTGNLYEREFATKLYPEEHECSGMHRTR